MRNTLGPLPYLLDNLLLILEDDTMEEIIFLPHMWVFFTFRYVLELSQHWLVTFDLLECSSKLLLGLSF